MMKRSPKSISANEPPTNRRRASKRKAALLGAAALSAVTAASLFETVYFSPPALAQAQGAEPAKPPAPAQAIPSFADVVDRVKPAVVSVRVKTPTREARTTIPDGDFDLPDLD